jgi:ssDNA-binding Zn-finger/Zn-ribbon topoisomerase 1
MKVKLGQTCPSCGEGKIVERIGTYGRFYGCTAYFKGCYFISKDIPPSEQEIRDSQAEEWAKRHKGELEPVI